MTRIFSLLVFAALFASCASTSSDSKKAADTLISRPDSVIQQYVKYLKDNDTLNENAGLEPREIAAADRGSIRVITGKFFDPIQALKSLYPGNYVMLSSPGGDDSILVSEWLCKECITDTFAGWYGEDSAIFPYTEGNITLVADTLYFTDDGGRRNVIIFSSVRLQDPEFISTGRFVCAVLGLAQYIYRDGNWELKTFSPELGCYGAFQTLPELHLIKMGKNNYGCYFLNTNGGAGGPFYSDMYVYGAAGNKFSQVMYSMGVKRSQYAVSGWDVRVHVTDNNTPYGDIIVTLDGAYDKKGFEREQDDPSNMPEEVHETMKQKNNFRFTVQRIYRFAEGRYTRAECKASIH